ncbi:MAG: hypothetical protein WBQ18_13805 [Solirubrobacteraceae bacterium]
MLSALALCAAAALFVAGPATSKRVSAAGRVAAAGAIGFSHAVIVDQQRPGFEPDVKIDSAGQVYTSVPFGFSTTQSFVWSSRDHGNSYQLTPGNVGPGKPSTCVGGGDTDLFLDSHDALYFSDLQGLTNISNSMSSDGGATWSTNCAGAPNAPDDRMWFTGTGSAAAGNLNLYQDYDAVSSSASGGNQLVETVSHDGTTFTPVINTGVGASCAGAALYNCVTNNEGISGNQVVDPSTGNVYIAHTTTNGGSGTVGVQVSEGKITPGTPTTATWTESPNLDAALCPNPTCVDAAGNPEEIAGENFASIARDSAGYLYVTFTAGPLDHGSSSDPNFGALTAPEQIYVVHSLQPAEADPAALTWSAPQRITGSGASAGTNTFPWITAGSDGRIDVAYYHAAETSEPGTCAGGTGTCTLYGASSLTKAEWTVQMTQTLTAHDASPSYTTANVTEAPVKHGQICTNGIGCATGGDRSLGDFLQVSTDSQGAALVSYVFDTSADSAAGENAGPEAISRQISGPSLLASVGGVSQNGGPGQAMGSVGDPTGDADFSSNGSRTAATPNLDLTGASLANGAGGTLDATLRVSSLQSLAATTAEGGPDASWLLRWTVVKPGADGNGDIYYVGMDNNAGAGGGGKPTFFAGDTAGLPPANSAEHTKYLTYPQTHELSAAQANYDASSGTITFHVPLADVGSPANGTVLLSATGFTATSATPQSATTLFNLIDATAPFELVVGPPGTGAGQGVNGGSGSSSTSGHGRCQPSTGKLTSRGIGRLSLGMLRSRARRIYPRWTSRGRHDMDFYCLRPTGVRGGYPSAWLLRHLSRGQRRRVQGRLIFASTASRRYALHGVRPGTRLTRRVARRLRVGHPYYVGRNVWYLTPNGSSHGMLKVRHGRIEEVGIADKRLTSNRAATRRFLRTFF